MVTLEAQRWVMRSLPFSVAMLAALLLTPLAGIVAVTLNPNEAVASLERMAAPARPSERNILAPLFTPEVQRWSAQIWAWARAYDLDPDLIATVMQIESCGDPFALSSSGAIGLFQVMPFHFGAHENPWDPETNARAGLSYLAEALRRANGDVAQALAGYNGGHAVIRRPERWSAETRRYVYWGVGIYEDARRGATESDRLQEWLEAGGHRLCEQAARRILR
ncbi:MAG: transglycosylase SLT domain-containing protein [Anaerolineae bacterium]|nr:transglycosylase SLT domain-containing protein [Thermoflexus sp.]MDW8065752.1 transglycosylase SLT domain-containing protein [Anaerolineae bacterium]